MLPIVVQKYGGSSVADVDALRRVAAAVVQRRRTGHAMVVVVSAMGNTTDALLSQAHALCDAPPRRELDMLVTAGERVSMALLSIAIASCGAAAISFTGSQSGIITSSQHQGARIVEVRPQRVLEALAAGRIVICAGYQGVSLQREVTTLGRGGSDTTAVALAAALQASVCEIFSDVDGVYSADPRLCAQAQLLPRLSYAQMRTMATAGAQVLCEEAVLFAQRAGITLVARRTGDVSGRHTQVGPLADAEAGASMDGDTGTSMSANMSAAAGTGTDVERHSGVFAVVGLEQVTRLVPNRADACALASLLPALLAGGARCLLHSPEAVWIDRTPMGSRVAGQGADQQMLTALAAQHGLWVEHGAAVSLLGDPAFLQATALPWLMDRLQAEAFAPYFIANGWLCAWVAPDSAGGEVPTRVQRLVQQLHAEFVQASTTAASTPA
jgi:uridylate kinase